MRLAALRRHEEVEFETNTAAAPHRRPYCFRFHCVGLSLGFLAAGVLCRQSVTEPRRICLPLPVPR